MKTMSMIHEVGLNKLSSLITQNIKQKIIKRKDSKEDNLKEVKVNNTKEKLTDQKFKLICICFGYIINTFLYFLFVYISDLIFTHCIFTLSKITNQNYYDNSIVNSIKHFCILFIWYNYLSGGFDGDPFFHFFKNKMKIINKVECALSFASNISGTILYLITFQLMNLRKYEELKGINITNYIKDNNISKENSFLTFLVYPYIPDYLKNILSNILIFIMPYNTLEKKYDNKIFFNNKDLYSSIIMDTFINEFICSFLSYILLYIYMFTKNNLSQPININLILTQIISLFSSKYKHIICGPYMSLSWIIHDAYLKKYPLYFSIMLMLSHFYAYKLATLLLKIPTISLTEAKRYFHNINYDSLNKYTDKNGDVNLHSLPDHLINNSPLLNTYLSKIAKFYFTTFIFKIHKKKGLKSE
ncbi:putative membrane protein [Plasmodium reichenowi]|uniref:Putative membrane protein n=1 Tax=Plasmodium reichenowi TaxID=5854 RepID=A0A151LJT9_PLARE|nr:putative membrane protein [Plasmodium reichenowi]KYN99172.1 putative membrane protein [Plasmodium reichenowi]